MYGIGTTDCIAIHFLGPIERFLCNLQKNSAQPAYQATGKNVGYNEVTIINKLYFEKRTRDVVGHHEPLGRDIVDARIFEKAILKILSKSDGK